MNDIEIIFRKMKNVAMTKPARSKKFLAFVRSQFPGAEAHHVFGSLGSLKSSDYCCSPVTPEEHRLHQDDRWWLMTQLPAMLEVQLKYIKFLEAEVGRKHGRR